jgi:hypothetical protein
VATREQVLELLDSGHAVESVGRKLGIPAGQVFMIANGVPADGSDSRYADAVAHGEGDTDSPQSFVNPPVGAPNPEGMIADWVRKRAARELAKSS